MKKLTSQSGFTLIELVVVIVILGILAATAAPKFIDLTGDAKSSVIEAVEGSIKSAADMAHAKSLVSGVTDGPISIAGSTIVFANGWPTEAAIVDLLELDGDIEEVSGTPGTFTHVTASDQATCTTEYDTSGVSSTNDRPDFNTDTAGC